MYKAAGVLGLSSRLMQLLLNRCSRLVSNLGVEVVAGVPQQPVSGYRSCRVDENDSSSLSLRNRTWKMHRIPPNQICDKELKPDSVPRPPPPMFL